MDNKKIKNGIMLFLFFLKIGCFTFGGGWSILSQMEQEFVEKRQLITKEQLLDLATIGKSVPGIMIMNISMLFGYQVAGIFGGFCAVLGIVTPAILILSIVAAAYDFLESNYWFHNILKGIQASVVPIIACAALSLGKDIFKSVKYRIIFGIAFLLIMFTGITNVKLIFIGIIISLIHYLTCEVQIHGLP